MSRRSQFVSTIALITSLVLCVGLVQQAVSQVPDCTVISPVDGTNLQSKFAGAFNVVQTNATGFGNKVAVLPADSEGNELCRLFVANDASTLYFGITGNHNRIDESDANTTLVFIDVDAGATATNLDTDGFTGGSLALLNLTEPGGTGARLDFDPEHCLAVWNVNGTQTAVLHDLSNLTDAGTVLTEGTHYAVDNSNLVGVSSSPADDPLFQEQNAATATTGFEFAIPLSMLGGLSNSATINVQALLVAGNGYVSNQSLPPLNATSGLNGGGVANLGAHRPNDPENPNSVNLDSAFPSAQYVAYTLSPAGSAPGGLLDGAAITAANYGPAIALQNNYTAFGDAAPFSLGVTDGNELDQIWVKNDFSKLYIGVTGNIGISGSFQNVLIVFIQTPTTWGANALFTDLFPDLVGPGIIQPLDQLQFDGDPGDPFNTGFRPNYAIQMWRSGGVTRGVIKNLDIDGSEIEMQYTNDPAKHTGAGFNVFTADLTNILGVNDIAGDDPLRQEDLAPSAVKGAQFSIDLAAIGQGSNQDISVMAMIASVADGGTNSFVSNQFLPPLNPTGIAPVCSADTFAPSLALSDDALTENQQVVVNAGAIARVTGIQVEVDITHPAIEELNVSLRHNESGRVVRLWDTTSGSGADLYQTFTFDGIALPDCTPFTAPLATSFETLLTFNGVDPNAGAATWTLIIDDTVAGNSGTLNAWSVGFRYDEGGGIGCVGTHNVDPGDGDVFQVDLTTFPGDQYFTTTLNAMSGAPTTFTGNAIPTAFGDPTAANPLARQNNYTCFGNVVEGSQATFTAGSEMDQMFLSNTADRIEMAITGNLETNGNAFVVLFDTITGGSSTLPIDLPNPPRPIGGEGVGTGDPGLNGQVLDTGFEPDYALVMHTFDSGQRRFRVDLVDLQTSTNRLIGWGNYDTGTGVLEQPLTGGSELNELFIQNDATNLYVGVTSNLSGDNGNSVLLFLDTKAGGSSTLSTTGGTGTPSQITGMDGDTLVAGFEPDYVLVLERVGATYQTGRLVDLQTLSNAPLDVVWDTTFPPVSGTFVGNNDNVMGVNSDDLNDPQTTANTATTGLQFALSRASIDAPADGNPIKVAAVIVNGSGYWSNQGLPGFGGSVLNLSEGPVDPVDASGVFGFVTYNMSGTPSVPVSWDGRDIPTAMGTALATQDNYTGFGDQTWAEVGAGNENCLLYAFNDTNVEGVTGANCALGDVSDAANVDTGMEASIALEDLGLTTLDVTNGTEIKVMAAVTGNSGYYSNNILPNQDPATGTLCNLGFLPNLTTLAGDQFARYALGVNPCGDDPADINGDSVVDAADVTAFVDVLLNGADPESCEWIKSEFVVDDVRNGLDIQGFVDASLGS